MSFLGFLVGVETLCFHGIVHWWAALLPLAVLVGIDCSLYLVPMPNLVIFCVKWPSFLLIAWGALFYYSRLFRRYITAIETAPGPAAAHVACCGVFRLHPIAAYVARLLLAAVLYWACGLAYEAVLNVTYSRGVAQVLVVLGKGAVDFAFEVVFRRVARLVPGVWYYTMFYFYSVKYIFSLLGMLSFSSVWSFLASEAIVLLAVGWKLLLLLPRVANTVQVLQPPPPPPLSLSFSFSGGGKGGQ